MAPETKSTAEHLRDALDGRWREVKNQTREWLSREQFRPHYTPNTVLARTKVAEQMSSSPPRASPTRDSAKSTAAPATSAPPSR